MIRRLHSDNPQIGYPYASSHEEMRYYGDVFKKIYSKKSIAEHWQPTMICQLHNVDIGRIVQSGQEFWVFTKKAKSVLEPLLGQSVEYLPTLPRGKSHEKISRFRQWTQKKIYRPILETVHEEQQYLVNILDIKTTDSIDFEQSKCNHNKHNGAINMVEHLTFRPESIANSHLFKIDNIGTYFQLATFVSDEFKNIVEANYLQGATFLE